MIYDIFRWVCIITSLPFEMLFFKRRTYYEDKTVQSRRIKGGALIISNHYCILDYIMNAFLVLPRKLNVVASEYAFRNGLIRFGMKFFGGIEANRVSMNMLFIDKSADIIKEGQLVQIFPEAQNTPDGNLHPFKKSYIHIAHKAQAPIIPIITDGNYGFFKRASVIIGKPIYISDYQISPVPTKEELEEINTQIFNKVAFLKENLQEQKTKNKKNRH